MKKFESAKLEFSYTNLATEKESRVTLNGLVENPDTTKLNDLAIALSDLIEDPFTGAVAIERYIITG
ncbi:hypothetical protein AAK938_07810 [Aerococcaceae bacterium 50-4]